MFLSRKPPRYDLPHAAPEPLRLVQRYVNTVDLDRESDWLGAWLAEHGVAEPTAAELERARSLREGLRELLLHNNDPRQAQGDDALAALDAAARRGRLTIDFSRRALSVAASGLDAIFGELAVVSYAAMSDGSWRRLKCCRSCRWAFYDNSKNRSATWCSMQICGNRRKTRSYRGRAHAQGAQAARPRGQT